MALGLYGLGTTLMIILWCFHGAFLLCWSLTDTTPNLLSLNGQEQQVFSLNMSWVNLLNLLS